MAFFTRVNLNVPVLPPEDISSDFRSTSQHRRHASEPAISGSSSGPVTQSRVHGVTKDVSAANVALISARTDISSTCLSVSTTANGIPSKEPTISVTDVTCNTSDIVKISENEKASEETNDEPRRYEYVVDRVLGVEV